MRLPYGHDVLGGQGNLKTQKLVQKLRETAIENRSRTYLLVLATSRLPVSLRNLRRTSFLTIIRLRDFLNWSIVYCGFFLLPYARHYNPWFVYFLPTFWSSFRFVTPTPITCRNEVIFSCSRVRECKYMKKNYAKFWNGESCSWFCTWKDTVCWPLPQDSKSWVCLCI